MTSQTKSRGRKAPESVNIQAELEKIEQDVGVLSRGDEGLANNYRFWLLHNRKVGLYGCRETNPLAVPRRRWIEENVRIKSKRNEVVPMKLNLAQRRLEANIIRIERREKPVRIVILKARQQGFSTYTVALAFWMILTGENVKVRVIANREDTAGVMLTRARLMQRMLVQENGIPWNLKIERDNRDRIGFGEPIFGYIEVVSANIPDPGHGETVDMLHMTETSRWRDAEEKAKGVEQTLPEVAGNYAFDETTANGNTGYYHDKFMRAWNRKRGIIDPESGTDEALAGGAGWWPMFFPWFEHEEYRWSWIHNRSLPEDVRRTIEDSLTNEERVLLQQHCNVRGRGSVPVSFDQLAWRRYFISEKCSGNMQTFHEQYPAFPEEAFLATGKSVFSPEKVKKLMHSVARSPEWKGELLEGETD